MIDQIFKVFEVEETEGLRGNRRVEGEQKG